MRLPCNLQSSSFLDYADKSVPLPQNYHLEAARRSLNEQVKFILLWIFAECGNRKALRLRAQGVYSCK